MTEDTRRLGSHLAQIDAHEITAEEYEDSLELDDDWFAAANLYIAGKLIRRGRPKSDENDPGSHAR